VQIWIDAAYLVAAVCFILGLRFLSHPRTARRGNQIAAAGMAIALAATIPQLNNWIWIVVGVVVGTAVGVAGARLVRMTAMPQMVALFNGVGGGAAALVSTADYLRGGGTEGFGVLFPIIFSAVVGSVSFAGSMIAFLKLQEWMTGRPLTYFGQQIVNGVIALVIVALAIYLLIGSGSVLGPWFVPIVVLGLILGLAFVLPIGGADMPVVISLLNAFTGLAAAATGFVLSNTVLIVAGILVGASGTLLTLLMSRAMGRSIANILFSAFGSAPSGAAARGGAEARPVRSAGADDVAALLAYADSVVFVPGYGLAVAQAQHQVRELADLLEKRGIDVAYAIHPVAGRMPGHMNVLLAEANVPYEQLMEMEQVNPQLERTDVAVVVGANDTVNPAAKNTPGSPIYGMPIVEVDKAKNVVVIKRSLAPGFAGIDNELYYNPKTTMLFGDAKKALTDLIGAVKTV
jgi:NAD(P) transhydrogenase subunit beta